MRILIRNGSIAACLFKLTGWGTFEKAAHPYSLPFLYPSLKTFCLNICKLLKLYAILPISVKYSMVLASLYLVSVT